MEAAHNSQTTSATSLTTGGSSRIQGFYSEFLNYIFF